MSLDPVRSRPANGTASAALGRLTSNGVKFFDAHTHVQFAVFDSDYKEVIKRAFEAGVGIVNVGTEKSTSLKAIKLAEEYKENIYAVVGLHPSHTYRSYHDKQELNENREGENFDYDFYRSLALDKKVVAVGECGLDYAAFVRERSERLQKRASAKAESDDGLPQEEIETRKNRQKEAFIKQIELANEVKKPLMIHCRNAYEDLIKILVTNSQLLDAKIPGIIHFFSGNIDDAKKLLELGFYFTFGGVITFVRPARNAARSAAGGDYDEVIKFIPLDKILSETDAPYVAPVPYRGKRNEPVHVIEVVKKLAEIKNLDFEEMRERIFKNTKTIFNLG